MQQLAMVLVNRVVVTIRNARAVVLAGKALRLSYRQWADRLMPWLRASVLSCCFFLTLAGVHVVHPVCARSGEQLGRSRAPAPLEGEHPFACAVLAGNLPCVDGSKTFQAAHKSVPINLPCSHPMPTAVCRQEGKASQMIDTCKELADVAVAVVICWWML